MARRAASWLMAGAGLSLLSGFLPSQLRTPPLHQYGQRTWQTQNGLPENTVRALVQTHDGYIWLGTDEGLVRYNGVDFVVFTHANTAEISSDIIEDLLEDRTGVLWISTSNGLTAFSQDHFQRVKGMTASGSGPVWKTHEGTDGRIWAASSEGICLVEQWDCHAIPELSYHDSTTPALFSDAPDGSVWVGAGRQLSESDHRSGATVQHLKTADEQEITALLSCSNGLLIGTREGLQRYQHGKLNGVPFKGLAEAAEITSLVEDGSGGAWVGTSLGLAHYEEGHLTRVATVNSPVRQVFRDRQGYLWLLLDRGVLRYSDGHVEHFDRDDPLSGATVLQMMQDREGNLWFGTDSEGLAMLHLQKFLTYTMRDGLSANVIRSIVQDRHSTVWIGTADGGVDKFSGIKFSALTSSKGLASDSVLSLASDIHGRVWAGTAAGLNVIDKDSIQTFTSKQGLADDFVRSLLGASDGTVWAGTAHGLSHIQQGRFTTFSRMDGLGSDFVGALLERRSGEIWVSTSGGVSRYDRGNFRTLTTQDGLGSNIVTAMNEDEDGTIWLASNGGVIDRYRKGRIESISSPRLPQTIYALLGDNLGHLWLSSRSGIFRVNKSDLNLAIEAHSSLASVKVYDVGDGMAVRECSGGGHPAAWKLSDGTLWFATMHGVTVVDPARIDDVGLPPQVALESFLVDDKKYSPAKSLVFGPGFHRLQFQFAGLSYAAPQKVRYQYQLEGFDKGWVDGGSRRAAFYNNLPAGKYIFQVRAIADGGQASASAVSDPFRIKPHLYDTIWFYLLMAIAVVAIAYSFYRWRVKQVAAVYEGVMSERTRIAREIHDTLAQSIVGISVKLEVVARLMRSSGVSAESSARQHLDETRALVKQSLEEARSSIWDLRMQSSEIRDLPKRIGSVLNRQISASSISGSVKVHGSYRALSGEVEEQLAKITQEAITNAVRHAHCTSIEVVLDYGIDRLTVRVMDDGKGLGEGARNAVERGHFGLRGIQERAERIGARLMIDRRQLGGVSVIVELPLT